MVTRFLSSVAVLLAILHTGAALGATIHVPGDQPTIQQGIDAAQPGDVVQVAPGTYAGPLNRDLDFRGKAIRVTGSFSTVVDCELLGRGFIFHSGEGAASILEYFTITRGRPAPGERGGGILFTGASSPAVRRVRVRLCEAEAGAGMEVDGSSPAITDCSIEDNGPASVARRGAGIDCRNGAAPAISQCVFLRNLACCASAGGAIAAAGASPTITECLFLRNGAEEGGAIFCGGPSTVAITGCTILGSDAERGAGIAVQAGASATVTGTAFCDNTAGIGAAIQCWGGATITVRNSTIVTSHYFQGPPSVIQAWSIQGYPPARVTLENTIVAHNTAVSVACLGGGTVTATCSDVFGNSGGDWVDCLAGQEGQAGNFALDPRICSLYDCDAHLRAGSPCLPGNHPQGAPCGLIGALGPGCASAVEPTTWGAIKAGYRE